MRKRIQNKEFTLITPNCLGGLLYHDLGAKFLSPTINLRIVPYDRFLLNMKWYLQQPLEFIESEESFPVAMLGGDVQILFVHYKTKEDAEKKWKERIGRIRWDNLYIIGSDIEINSPEKIEEVVRCVPYKKMLIFTSRDYKIKNTVYIPKYRKKEHVGNLLAIHHLLGKRKYEIPVDLVKWLNEE